MTKATHFIEVWRDSKKEIHYECIRRIQDLETTLYATTIGGNFTYKTIAVFKIKFK